MWATATLFVAKTLNFFEIYGVPHGQVESVRTFFGQGGRGSIFRDFVRASFMGGPLSKKCDLEDQDQILILKIKTTSKITVLLIFNRKRGYIEN